MARWFVDRLPQRGIPSVSLRRLLPEARFVGCPDWEVSGCTADSRRLDPGQVFVAVRGARHDGHALRPRRRWSGARRAWWSSGPAPRRAGSRWSSPTPGPRTRGSARPWPATRPSSSLTVGVTGTCGRTVASLFLRSIFEAAGGAVRAGRRARLVRRRDDAGPSARRPRPGGPRGWRRCSPTWSSTDCAGGRDRGRRRGARRRRCFEGVALRRGGRHRPGRAARPARPRPRCGADGAKARLFRKVVPGGAAVVNADDPHAEILGAVNLDARRVASASSGPPTVDVRADRAARRVGLAVPAPRLRPRGGRRRSGWSARGTSRTPWPRPPLAWSHGARRSTPSSPASRRSRTSPAGSKPSTRGRTSTSGSTQAATGAELLARPSPSLRGRRRRPGPLRPRRRGDPGPPGRAGPWPTAAEAGRRPRDPDHRQPPDRGPRPDPRRPARRLPPPGPGPGRARPPAGPSRPPWPTPGPATPS